MSSVAFLCLGFALAGGPGAWSHLGSTAPGVDQVIPLDSAAVGRGPYLLDRAGMTYVLREDIVTPGSAFVFAAEGVTLDLGGHTVTFGAVADSFRYGVAIPPPFPHTHPMWTHSDVTTWRRAFGATIRNGRIVQDRAGGPRCAAVIAYGQRDLTVEGTAILIFGDDTCAMQFSECATLQVRENTIIDSTAVISNRHAGRAAIDVMTAGDGILDIHGNIILNCRQWGIRVQRRRPATVWGRIFRNRIEPNAIVANGYGIGLHGDRLEAYANTIEAKNGRGIHIELCDQTRVHHNEIRVTEQPTWGVETRVSAHGIKLEQCTGAEVYANRVESIGRVDSPTAVGNGAALVIGVSSGSRNRVYENTFIARHLGGQAYDPSDYRQFATAIEVVGIGMASGLVIESNIFVTEDRFFTSSLWHGPAYPDPMDASDVVIRNNQWTREASPVAAHAYDLFFMDSSVSGLRFLDNAGGNFRNFGTGWPWHPCSWNVAFTGAVRVFDAGQASRPGVDIEIRDSAGTPAQCAVTPGTGEVRLTLDAFTILAGGQGAEQVVRIEERNPYTFTALFPGSPCSARLAVTAPGFRVVLSRPQP